MTDRDIRAGIASFINTLQNQSDTENPNYLTYKEDGNGQNFQRIVFTYNSGAHGGSCVGFVALRDGKTKGLGEYKEGDIFYGAGWAGPAKGVRGNVYVEAGKWATNGRGGIRYLK